MSEREIAIRALLEIHYNEGYASEILKVQEFSDNREAGFVKSLVYGVLEEINRLDIILSKLSKTPLKKLDREILEILRISLYQYLFMDKIPDYAILNEALDLTEKFSHEKSKGFVNGVLRNMTRKGKGLAHIKVKGVDNQLMVDYSISKEMLDILKENYSIKTIRKILKSYQEPGSIMVRVNLLKTNPDVLQEILRGYGYEIRVHQDLDFIIIVENPSGLTELKEFTKGYFTIQDASSVMAAYYADPKEGYKVLDLCAAPGSKTCQMSEAMKNTGLVVANDIHSHKEKFIKENASRLGAKNIEYSVADGTVFNEEWKDAFDLVLLDAPCSGTGIIRKKPEIKLRRTKKDIEELVDTQKKLIQNAVLYLKEGGDLLYSTCSILDKENEDQRRYLLEDFDLVGSPLYYKGGYRDYLKIMPYEKDQDGFFISKFKKKEKEA